MIYLPEYTYGACKKCNQICDLGDGLCQKCFDGPDDPEQRQEELRERNKEILKMLSAGQSPYKVARIFKLAPSTIKGIDRKGMSYA